MEEALMAALRADAGVAALAGARVTWGSRPARSPLPAIVLHLIASPKTHTYRGRDGLTQSLVQVDCLAGSYLEAKALARAASAALDRMKTQPLQAFLVDERDDDFSQADGPDAAGASEIFRTIIDVRVWSS